MSTVSFACALLLTVVFFTAAVAKLRSPATVAQAVTDFGIPRWVSPLVAPAEIVVVVLLVVAPGFGSVSAAGLLVVFTGMLVRVLRGGTVVSCGCFGSASSKEPVTNVTVARNLGLLLLTVPAGFSSPLLRVAGLGSVALVALGLLLSGQLLLALLSVRRITGAMFPSVRVPAEVGGER